MAVGKRTLLFEDILKQDSISYEVETKTETESYKDNFRFELLLENND